MLGPGPARARAAPPDMAKKILITLLALFAVVAVVGMALPKAYTVSRSARIEASTERIFSLVGDLKAWPAWEPFSASDPTTRTTLGERTAGVGAKQSWVGEGGSGNLTFTSSDPTRGIAYDLEFCNGGEPCPARSAMEWTASGSGVDVTWTMSGDMDFPIVGGYFALLADSMIGPMFERGLERLEQAAEKPAP